MLHKISDRRGFTMIEILGVVAAIVIIVSIGVGAVRNIIKSYNQMERDDNAKAIYIAVQDNLAGLTAKGKSVPWIAGKDAILPEAGVSGVRYATSSDAAVLSVILPEGSIDSVAAAGTYYIEYDPALRYVYGVFFEAADRTPVVSYAELTSAANNEKLRNKRTERRKLEVGYYGYGTAGAPADGNGNELDIDDEFIQKTDQIVDIKDDFSGVWNYYYDPSDPASAVEAGDKNLAEPDNDGKDPETYFCNLNSLVPETDYSFVVTVTSNTDITTSYLELTAKTIGCAANEYGTNDLCIKYKVERYLDDWQTILTTDYRHTSEPLNLCGDEGGLVLARVEDALSGKVEYFGKYRVTVTLEPNMHNSGGTGYFMLRLVR